MRPTPSCEIYIDGASRGNPGPAGIGVVFVGKDGTPSQQLSKYLGETTNNVAEYLALVYALVEALRAGHRALTIKTDSELLARQLGGQYRVKDPQLRLFHDLAVQLSRGFARCTIEHIPRTKNALADRLAGEAVSRRPLQHPPRRPKHGIVRDAESPSLF